MRIKVKKIREEIKQFSKELKSKFITFVVGAFSFVTALQWNDAIRSIIERWTSTIQTYVPFPDIYLIKIYVALIITFVSVFVVYMLSGFLKEE